MEKTTMIEMMEIINDYTTNLLKEIERWTENQQAEWKEYIKLLDMGEIKRNTYNNLKKNDTVTVANYSYQKQIENERYGNLLKDTIERHEEKKKAMKKAIDGVVDFAKDNLQSEKEKYGNLLSNVYNKYKR